jgi:periplasmic mercuric ion binding protein
MKILMLMTLIFMNGVLMAKEIEVKVSGMVCSMCAQGIQKSFKQVEGVSKIHVDLDKKVVLITTENDKDVNDSDIEKAITEAGYNVASITRK